MRDLSCRKPKVNLAWLGLVIFLIILTAPFSPYFPRGFVGFRGLWFIRDRFRWWLDCWVTPNRGFLGRCAGKPGAQLRTSRCRFIEEARLVTRFRCKLVCAKDTFESEVLLRFARHGSIFKRKVWAIVLNLQGDFSTLWRHEDRQASRIPAE